MLASEWLKVTLIFVLYFKHTLNSGYQVFNQIFYFKTMSVSAQSSSASSTFKTMG